MGEHINPERVTVSGQDNVTGVLNRCECHDGDCPVDHDGRCSASARVELDRIDMHLEADHARVVMCYGCSDDALASGIFATIDSDERSN